MRYGDCLNSNGSHVLRVLGKVGKGVMIVCGTFADKEIVLYGHLIFLFDIFFEHSHGDYEAMRKHIDKKD